MKPAKFEIFCMSLKVKTKVKRKVQQCLQQSVHSGGCFMVWGCISNSDVGDLIFFFWLLFRDHHSGSVALISPKMFSRYSGSFNNNDTCYKCSLFSTLEGRLTELETRLCTFQNPVASQAPVVSVGQGSLATVS